MTARLPMIRLSRGSTIAMVVAGVLSWLSTTLIYANVEQGIAIEKSPLPVKVIPFTLERSYLRSANFMGVVRAGNDSVIGFEVSGTIDTMIAREGLRVRQGDPLATLDTDRRHAQMRAAEAELARIDAQLELARVQRERIADLEKRGLASQQNYDEARLNEAALSATRTATLARFDSARLEIEKSTLTAHFDGVIAERLAQEGVVVNAGSPILRLVADRGYEAHIGVPSGVGARLVPSQNYRLTIGSESVSAPLRAVRTDVDPATLTVGVILELPDSVQVHAGENAVLHVEETVASEGGWVPISALTEGDRGLWDVLVVTNLDGQQIAQRESVEIIYSRDDQAFVRGTLAEGAQVIATGLQRLSPGTIVQPMKFSASQGSR